MELDAGKEIEEQVDINISDVNLWETYKGVPLAKVPEEKREQVKASRKVHENELTRLRNQRSRAKKKREAECDVPELKELDEESSGQRAKRVRLDVPNSEAGPSTPGVGPFSSADHPEVSDRATGGAVAHTDRAASQAVSSYDFAGSFVGPGVSEETSATSPSQETEIRKALEGVIRTTNDVGVQVELVTKRTTKTTETGVQVERHQSDSSVVLDSGSRECGTQVDRHMVDASVATECNFDTQDADPQVAPDVYSTDSTDLMDIGNSSAASDLGASGRPLLDLTGQVPPGHQGPDILWSAGAKTKGPWINRKKAVGQHHDRKYILKLARDAEPIEKCPYYTHIPYDPHRKASQTAALINEAWTKGHCWKMDGPPGEAPVFNLENVVEDTALQTDIEMQVLDALMRTNVNLGQPEPNLKKDYSAPEEREARRKAAEKADAEAKERKEKGEDEPAPPPEDAKYHVWLTLRQFFEDIDSGKFVRALLDAPSMDAYVADFVKHLDDAYRAYCICRSIDPYRSCIPMDLNSARSWLLLHYALFHTYQHFDSEGYATYVEVVSGWKFWVFTFCEDVYAARTKEEFRAGMLKHKAHNVRYTKNIKRYVVFAGPGDMMQVFYSLSMIIVI
ncbi:hypothetical protein EIP91_005634 [Steccherinum ochraceum]|uniref:Uncharacterized protein n=1 Tax=Steccherinum ochraceum TaxID=92696 RepID=A0A4R0R9I9_9APHY|nr:hypothetical protein EIP91_005634 [Steccherinum ochraceum]